MFKRFVNFYTLTDINLLFSSTSDIIVFGKIFSAGDSYILKGILSAVNKSSNIKFWLLVFMFWVEIDGSVMITFNEFINEGELINYIWADGELVYVVIVEIVNIWKQNFILNKLLFERDI